MKLASLLKIGVGVLILAAAGMVYWSSLLQEKDLKSIRQEMQELREEAASLRMHKVKQESTKITRTSLMDPQYPNLLETDPYFETTLPKMLPAHFRPHGILKKAMIGKPENLHPFNHFKDVQEMNRICLTSLAQFKTGCYETLSPNMAT